VMFAEVVADRSGFYELWSGANDGSDLHSAINLFLYIHLQVR
jgi:hypothetical protein